MTPELRALHVLLGRLHLWIAGRGELTVAERRLIEDLATWYEDHRRRHHAR